MVGINKFREEFNEESKFWLYEAVKKDDIRLEGNTMAVEERNNNISLKYVKKSEKHNKHLLELLNSLEQNQKVEMQKLEKEGKDQILGIVYIN